jgi:hypothetical protein
MMTISLNNHSSSQSIPLTPSQAVRIHGWLQPRQRLRWQTVKDRPDLTFTTLLNVLLRGSQNIKKKDIEKIQRLDTLEEYELAGVVCPVLEQLYTLQPSVLEWINAGKVVMNDYNIMHLIGKWRLDPINDFSSKMMMMKSSGAEGGGDGVKIGEILQANLKASTLSSCGIDVDRMISLGMTPNIMALFRYSLQEWKGLSIKRKHIDSLSNYQSLSIFGLNKNVLEGSIHH